MTSGSATSEGIDQVRFEQELNNSGVDTSGTNWGAIWGAFGCLASIFALKIGLAAHHDAGSLGKMSLVVGVLSLAIASSSLAIGGVVGLAMSLIAAGMGALALLHNFMERTDVHPVARVSAAFSLVVDATALTVSGIGIYFSVQNLCRQGA